MIINNNNKNLKGNEFGKLILKNQDLNGGKLTNETISNNVKNLIIENEFQYEILPGIIPTSVKSLTLNQLKYPIIIESIPSNVEELILTENFNQKLTTIPNTIKKLILYNHKYPIEKLPEGLEEIEIMDGYSHEIPIGWFSSTIETCHLGDISQKIIPNLIPETIQNLFLTENFNQNFNFNLISSKTNLIYF